MTNVISISCTCEYLVKRAASHRRNGRYDEAMTLLWKARNQFGSADDVLWETAQVYDEMGCEDEAEKAYLRLVRLHGTHRAEALFHLSVSSLQRGDFARAASYFDFFRQCKEHQGISSEMVDILAQQLSRGDRKIKSLSAKRRAKALEKHAAACLQAGRTVAAQRAMEHALRLRPSARGYTMLACCQLIRMKFDDAVASAKIAHRMSPSNVQTLCVLADAYMAVGNEKSVRNAIYLAALRAEETDDILAVCVESAKAGYDGLTLQLTKRMLKRAPFHTRAMMIRAFALINSGRNKEAERLLGRLCVLVPENSIYESYYRLLRDGHVFKERLTLGIDVTHEEGVNRAAELITLLYADPKALDEDKPRCTRVCRMCEWAFYSLMAGPSTKMAALGLLIALQSKEAREILLDVLISPHLSDSLKLSALQVLVAKDGFQPYEVDMGGKLVRLAAGGVSTSSVRASEANSKIVQRIADRLLLHHHNAVQELLDAFLTYVQAHGHPDKKHESACEAALEYWYLCHIGQKADEHQIASFHGVSVRIMRIYEQRLNTCLHEQEQPQQGE